MKYKFHEQSPSADFYEDWADNRKYTKEINWICKNAKWDVNKIKIDDLTFGYEPVIFYKGQYAGYLDQWFYLCFEKDDFESYWGFDN